MERRARSLLPPTRFAFFLFAAIFILLVGAVSIPAFSEDSTTTTTGDEAAREDAGGADYVSGCILGGDICLARVDTGDGNIFSALWATLTNVYNFFTGLFAQLTASGREWDNLPAQIPKPKAEQFLEAYGIPPEEFAGSCSRSENPAIDWFFVAFGSVATNTILRVDAFGSLGEEELYIANGLLAMTIVMVLILIIFFLEMPGYSVSHEIISGSSVGHLMKDLLVAIFPNVDIVDLVNAPEDDPAQADVSWGRKVLDKFGRFYDNVTTPWDTKAIMGAAGSEGERDGTDSFGRDMSKESVIFVARDLASAFSIVALKGGVIIALGLAATFLLFQFQIPEVSTDCNTLIFKIYLATFWAFWIWQIIVYTVKSLAFIFAALLPRPVVAWLLVPFTGGPVPVLDLVLRMVFRVLGILYILGLAKPVSPGSDLGQLALAAFAAMLFYMLTVITSIGVKVLLTVWTHPFEFVFTVGETIIGKGAENAKKKMTKSPTGTQKVGAEKWRTKQLPTPAGTTGAQAQKQWVSDKFTMGQKLNNMTPGKTMKVLTSTGEGTATKNGPNSVTVQHSAGSFTGGVSQVAGRLKGVE
ncbi:MAG: hypothetical protein V1820_03175 [archaeon]